MAENIRNRTDLVVLNLRDDALKAEGFMSMLEIWKGANFASLVSLDLSGMNASLTFYNILSMRLSLWIVGDDLDSECIAAFTRWVSGGALANVQHLWLDDNELGNDGAKELAKAVSSLKSLVSLSCCTCEIMGDGAYSLAKAVSKLPHFQKAELNGNLISSDNLEKMSVLLMRCGKILGGKTSFL